MRHRARGHRTLQCGHAARDSGGGLVAVAKRVARADAPRPHAAVRVYGERVLAARGDGDDADAVQWAADASHGRAARAHGRAPKGTAAPAVHGPGDAECQAEILTEPIAGSGSEMACGASAFATAVVPRPSRPSRPQPHVYTRPSAVSAADVTATPDEKTALTGAGSASRCSSGTRVGVGTSLSTPSPVSPNAPLPHA